jgi:hypothetical protein
VITDNTCLPDGCYYLRVFDAGGDGIANGGYILRTRQAVSASSTTATTSTAVA